MAKKKPIAEVPKEESSKKNPPLEEIEKEKPLEESKDTAEAQKEEEEKAKEEAKLNAIRKAGEIHKQVVEFIKPKVKVGAKVLEICEEAEQKIIELGGEIGFPVNCAINEHAAHYTATLNDERIIQEGDVVKVDIGVAIDGWVADAAFTVNFNKESQCKNLVLAVETALKAGLLLIKPGVETREIGEKTEAVIKQFGYHPIPDLTGHKIEEYELHSGKIIPNCKTGRIQTFEEGEIYGFEVFASTGIGKVHSSSNVYIYSLDRYARPKVRNKSARKILKYITERFQTLPFSEREILKKYPLGKFGINQLLQAGCLHQHNLVKEKSGEYVAQYEHTILITEDGYEQIT